MELYIPFHTLVCFVDAEEIRDEETRTLDLPQESFQETSNLQSQIFTSEKMDQILQISLHKQLIRIINVNLIFGKLLLVVKIRTTLFQTAFENNDRKKKKADRFLFSIESACKITQSNFQRYLLQIHLNGQPLPCKLLCT